MGQTNTETTSQAFKPGDAVTHFTGKWGSDTEIVDHVNFTLFPADPVVFFVGGGFWRSSYLVKVTK